MPYDKEADARRQLEKRLRKSAERAEAAKLRGDPPPGISHGQDALVVLTEELAILVEAYVENHNRGLDPQHDLDLMTGLDYLEYWSGCDKRTISRVIKRERPHTSYQNADKLLTAMGLAHAFGVHVHVRPNPRWSNERYLQFMEEHQGCCVE